MKITFDQGTPVPLRQHLTGHSAATVHELGWSSLENGMLLDAAEQVGYELLITTDQKLHYQQNLTHRRIAILVLLSTSWLRIRARLDEIRPIVDQMSSADYREPPDLNFIDGEQLGMTTHRDLLNIVTKLNSYFEPYRKRLRDNDWGPDCSRVYSHFVKLT